ncbi:hypothetical protein PHLGIDRAFT_101971 [Phlebiopsis gigantea 11061_1 CR5-6]|uniref:RING-type domain-containing protein n=1 Tax=Phlebiopsis gigantea (strain 11061_1 CR5-6) TaxID=745531 RepID=A0A0C3SBB1_PHLG1|nr:hypothetical protein PHLGIDRAFT_101971 [Phlebiopsis gigantea 11061_1 CR5-6]
MFEERFVEMRLILSDVDQEMKRVQAALSEVENKPYRTQDDVTRIVNLESELWRLIELKEDCSATIHSVPGATRSGTSEYTSAPAYNMQHQSVPSGSNVHLPPAFQDPDFAQQRNVLVNNGLPQVNAPVASGSGVKLEEHTGYAKVETDALDLDFRRVTADMPGMIQPLSDDERFDEDGNFYGRGRDTFHGPVAKADDIDNFFVSAGNAELFDGNASVEKALNKLRLPVLYTPLPGMEIALMPHQVIGVAWMLEKERGSEKGGCLADEMGLGKTVQMIATIAMNLSPDPLRKTTLIVAPLALLDQWKLEIETKTNLNLQCLIYHGNKKSRSLDQLRKYDVVLTTFQTLANEWPDEEAEEKAKKKRKKRKTQNGFIVDDDSEEEKALKKNKKTKGPLFITEWYRIVLDEAQNIRNRRTRVSRAVSKLQSTYRWCLTGTPIINGLADAYGLLRFLQYRPWYDWENFNGHISRIEKRNPMLATSRLQAIFKAILLRRKKDTMLDGKRLIELPSKEVILHKLEFSPEERAVYNMVEAKSQAIFNRFLRAGTVLKNYHQVLVLLLRLRQVCSHPSLIQEEGEEEGVAYVDPGQEDISQKTVELARAERLLGLEFVQRMQAKFRQITLERIAAEKASAEATLEGDDIECPVCFDNYADPIITACGHSFCRECINNVLNAGPREDAAEPTHYKADERPCPACRGAISHDMIFSRVSFEPSDEELRGAMAGPVDVGGDVKILDAEAPELKPARAVRKRKGPSRRVLDSDEEETDGDDDGLSDFIVKDDEDENEKDARWRLKGKRKEIIVLSDDEDDDLIIGAKPDVPAASDQIKLMPKFLPSTKMKHMMESLKEWAETHPSEKTLIVSQWTGCLELVSNYLTENQFAHVKYQGNMRRGERDRVVRAFMSKDKAAVMLMSLKCGGVGLNLTRANRVINLDLGWSLAIEQQAYDRVHRLGQHRDVFVHRLVIANTVEDRILTVQERKKGLAESSLGEGGGKKLGRLSVKELANLFGLDHRGRLLEPQAV